MRLGTGIIIFLLGIVALVAELVLYFVFGFGAAFSGNLRAVTGIAFFFVSLMILTAATAVLAPIGATVELVAKRKNLSYYIMLPVLGLLTVGLLIFGAMGTAIVDTPSDSTSETNGDSSQSVEEAEKAAYISKVAVRDVKVGRSVLDELGVFGEIKNTGDKTLRKVQITIYCLDRDGNAIFEKKYHPVFVTSTGIGFRDNEPLKPNYSKKFGVKLDDAPSEWSRKVRIEVSEIEFASEIDEPR